MGGKIRPGHHRTGKNPCGKALAKLDGNEKTRTLLAFADLTVLWGDFYTGEKIIRQQLAEDPTNEALHLKLARNLSAQQRYDEARKYLLRIIKKKEGQPSKHYYDARAGTG
jgi:predicted Zn-dependent protease